MDYPELKPMEKTCAGIVAATNGLLSWEWDERFGAALTVFPSAEADAVLKALEATLPKRYTSDDIADASEVLSQVADALGGLRRGQILLCSHPDSDTFLFGAWWPWGDGQRISLRIAGVADSLDELSQTDLAAKVRGWFGL